VSNHALSWAWKQQTSDPTSKLILIKLADQANDDGECWPSQSTLAAECGVSVPTVKRRVGLLEAQGLLTRSQRRASGFHQSNMYVLSMNDGGSTVIPGEPDGGSAVIPDGGSTVIPKPKQEPSEVLVGTTANAVEPTSGPPPLHKVDGQNLAFNALRDLCGIRPNDVNRTGEIVAALNGGRGVKAGIRELVWGELVETTFDGDEARAREVVDAVPVSFESAVVDVIERRGDQYRRAMNGATLTPTALAKWWLSLEGMAEAGSGGLTAAQMAAFPDA